MSPTFSSLKLLIFSIKRISPSYSFILPPIELTHHSLQSLNLFFPQPCFLKPYSFDNYKHPNNHHSQTIKSP
ncbi:unnamed protein product [Prunus brigantina]